ncbi:MAG: LCP family protein [Actinobacteria bacterium]|nr:LCP family protein [Actinomycetota bacterium]
MRSSVDIIAARTRRHPIIRAVGSFAAICLMATLWWASAPFRGTASSATPTTALAIHKVQGTSWHPGTNQPVFILVLGSDTRNGPPETDHGRCDAIHILAINPQQKAGSIIDIPRDSYMTIPGHGQDRINTACYYGGPEGMVQLIKTLSGIQVQYYVLTEFSNFMALINEVGGVDVNVPYAMHDPVGSGANFEPGVQHLDGGNSLAFCRNRHATPKSDFSRTDNQGQFMLAAFAKFKKEAVDQHRIFDYIKAAERHTKINVPVGDLINLALLAEEIDPANIKNLPLEGAIGRAGAASVVFLDPRDVFTRVKDDGIY